MDIIKPGRVIDFMGMRRFWVILSASLMLISMVLLWKPGPKYGIDFLGGTELTVRFNRSVDPGRLRDTLSHLGYGAAEVVPSANMPNTYLIRVERSSSM